MASEVLQKTRRINRTLQASAGSSVSFDLLTGALGEVLGANVYVLSTKGKVLGLHLHDVQDSSVIEDEITKQKKFPEEYTKSMLRISETLENLTGGKVLEYFPYEQDRLEKKITLVPIFGSGQRLGTLVLSRYNELFNDDVLLVFPSKLQRNRGSYAPLSEAYISLKIQVEKRLAQTLLATTCLSFQRQRSVRSA